MRLFIGWSGERSQILAKALRDWVPLVLNNVEPWLSEIDIEAGQRWDPAIAQELAGANFGIFCITHENINSPWILFEAGALSKSLEESKVIPLLLDLEFMDIKGPFARFQAKKVNREGIFEVIKSINNSVNQEVPERIINERFEGLWFQFERLILSIPKLSKKEKQSRSEGEILEELVLSVRSLDSQFREFADDRDSSFSGPISEPFNISIEFPERDIKSSFIKILPEDYVSNVLNKVWSLLDRESSFSPQAYTYLWDWILIRKRGKLPLFLKAIHTMIPAHIIFKEGEKWEVVKLDEPLISGTERFDIERLIKERW